MESYISSKLISDNDKKLNRNISYVGKKCYLNSGKGIYVNFINTIKDKINDFDDLNILKDENYYFSKINVLTNFTVDSTTNNHNFMDMRKLFKLALRTEPTYTYPKKGYDMFLCPFHDDHNASAKVSQHIFQCYKHNQMQFDQTAFLKRLFHLNTVKEVENKFQELQDTSKH